MYIKVGARVLLAEKKKRGGERMKRFSMSIRGGMTILFV
jgi:hypothetical protein